jgi:hypothetical protein
MIVDNIVQVQYWRGGRTAPGHVAVLATVYGHCPVEAVTA